MISAPGKILLLGGYAVLDYHPALSIAVVDGKGLGSCASTRKNAHRIVSEEFGIDASPDPRDPLAALRGAERSHRVALSAYATAMAYFDSIGHKPEPLEIVLDNSQVFGAKDEKSGLGSSAASTVALIAALMDGNGFDVGEGRDHIHRLGQIAHSLATRKSGSGFDVATSAFGTIEYVRFEKGLIGLEEGMAFEEFSASVAKLMKTGWPRLSIRKAGLPYGLLAFNIKGAKTSTISSVRAVGKLAEHVPELYENMMKGQVAGEGEVFEGLRARDPERIREGMRSARKFQRLLSGWVGRIGMMDFDPIEPPSLGALIDRAEELPGIIAGRCPGSGGFDSVAFLTDGECGADGILKIGRTLGLTLERLDIAVTPDGVRKA